MFSAFSQQINMSDDTTKNNNHQTERFCKYIHRYCNQTRLDGFDFCIRHILEDKDAPFRQCTYVNQPNNKRCSNAAPKVEKIDKRDFALCPFHSKKAQIRSKVVHFKRKSENDGKIETSGDQLSPASASKSLRNNALMENLDDDFTWVEKPSHSLDNAGVYTHKEILRIASEKIVNLQKLYQEELNMIYHKLKEQRREFLATVSPSYAETLDNLSRSLSHQDLKELIDMAKFHRPSATEQLMRQKARAKRLKSMKPVVKKPLCVFEKNEQKCSEPAIVLTKYCKKHILHDPKQILYRPCGFEGKCKIPVLPLVQNALCDLHFHSSLANRSMAKQVSQPIEPSLFTSTPSASASKPLTDIEQSTSLTELEPTTADLVATTVEPSISSADPLPESDPFQAMGDITSLTIDDISPEFLLSLGVFGDANESADLALTNELMQIEETPMQPPPENLNESIKTD